ncbi:MAG: hypothetical protein ACLQBD_29555 [Syntrophobacteraceae bacterium]
MELKLEFLAEVIGCVGTIIGPHLLKSLTMRLPALIVADTSI